MVPKTAATGTRQHHPPAIATGGESTSLPVYQSWPSASGGVITGNIIKGKQRIAVASKATVSKIGFNAADE